MAKKTKASVCQTCQKLEKDLDDLTQLYKCALRNIRKANAENRILVARHNRLGTILLKERANWRAKRKAA